MAFVFGMPVLVLVMFSFENDFRALIFFISALFALFLLEIRIRFGSLSKANLTAFFNTPIDQTLLTGEKIVDNSPRFSLLTGTLIILCLGIFVFIGLAFIYS